MRVVVDRDLIVSSRCGRFAPRARASGERRDRGHELDRDLPAAVAGRGWFAQPGVPERSAAATTGCRRQPSRRPRRRSRCDRRGGRDRSRQPSRRIHVGNTQVLIEQTVALTERLLGLSAASRIGPRSLHRPRAVRHQAGLVVRHDRCVALRPGGRSGAWHASRRVVGRRAG